MATLANIVLDIKTTNPSLKTDVIANTVATSVSNNTVVNSIKTRLNTSTNPSLTALSNSVSINAASLAVEKKIPPVFVGPVTYSNTDQVSVLRGWFAGGDGTNKIIKSSDGQNWTKVTQTAFVNEVDAFAFGINNANTEMLVAVGAGGSLVGYSTDLGNTWIRGSPLAIFGTYGRDVIYGKDPSNVSVWYGVGANTPMAYSYNGINWVSKGTTIAGTNILRGIAFGNNQYVAVGNNGINLSTDFGNTWTNVSTLTVQGRGVAYGLDVNGNGLWIAVGGGNGIIAKSTDGITWTAVANAASQLSQGNKIAYGTDSAGNRRWVLGGSGAKIMVYTNDGITFTQCSGISSITSVAYITCGINTNGTPLWIAVGTGTQNLLRSNDGITWTSFTDKTNLITNNAIGVHCAISKYNKPQYLNYTPGTTKLFASVDGITTSTAISSPFSIAINKIATNGTMWVAVGEGTNTIAYSTNGITWTGLGTTLFSVKGTNVTWNATENKWYAYGSGTNTTLTSTNGINWV